MCSTFKCWFYISYFEHFKTVTFCYYSRTTANKNIMNCIPNTEHSMIVLKLSCFVSYLLRKYVCLVIIG